MELSWLPQDILSLKVKVRVLTNTHGSILSHHGKDKWKHPFLNRRHVFAWLRLGEYYSLCQYQECGSDQQKTLSLAWFLCGDCNGPFLLTGVCLSKMDFCSFSTEIGKTARGSLWIGSPSKALEDNWSGGGLCVWNSLDRTEVRLWHTITSMCDPAACKLLPCKEKSVPSENQRTFVHPLYLRDAACLSVGGNLKKKKKANTFLDCAQSGFCVLSMPSFLILQSIFPL